MKEPCFRQVVEMQERHPFTLQQISDPACRGRRQIAGGLVAQTVQPAGAGREEFLQGVNFVGRVGEVLHAVVATDDGTEFLQIFDLIVNERLGRVQKPPYEMSYNPGSHRDLRKNPKNGGFRTLGSDVQKASNSTLSATLDYHDQLCLSFIPLAPQKK